MLQFGQQLDSLHAISVEIAALRSLSEIYDRALGYCLELTESEMGFIDLLVAGRDEMDVVAVKGFQPSDPGFYERNRRMPVRPSVFGVTITEERSNISNDVEHDPGRSGQPRGHPPVHTFLGVPLRVGPTVIGMIGVANRSEGYGADEDRLLSTFANQVAVAIDNARLYERQQEMITGLQGLHRRLGEAERDHLLSRERERIAAGLHDHLAQSIFSVGVQLSSLLDDELDPKLEARLRDLRQQVGRAADEIREVIFALSGKDHANSDLTSLVRALLRRTERDAGLDTELVVTGVPTPGVAGVQDVLYDVITEVVGNVVKHAQASTVLVSIRFDADRVDVIVQDDGVGASDVVLRNYPNSYLHFGLRHRREQILELGGRFDVENGEESGVIVTMTVPVASASP
jgi:signal transduction histidine kinase